MAPREEGRTGRGPGRPRAPVGAVPPEAPRVVGVVGLGTMGGALARHLLAAGCEVVGCDVAAAAARAFEAAGGTPAGTPAEVAARAEVVFLSLPSERDFEEVVSGAGGLTGAAPPGRARVAVELSTLSLDAKEGGRRALRAHGIELLDCPISGTGAQMARGGAVFYLSGDEEAAAVARPLLEACGEGVFSLGGFGNGTRLKLVANHLVAVHNAAAAEAIALARAHGIDPAAALPALLAGAGSSKILELRGPMMVERAYEPPTMRLRTFLKDLGIIGDFARVAGCALEVFDAAAKLHRRADAQGWGDADAASLHEVVGHRPARP